MGSAAYTVFFIFGGIWVVMGAAALIFLLKSEGQSLRLDGRALLVALPIVIPMIAALTIAALYH
ncbi:MAG: hypothetical protein LH702_24265 [Phormidesmis sp. CAN_BIN44]|nr:hypothetical protein [Phormidesmis sp. CAN_BIN44]